MLASMRASTISKRARDRLVSLMAKASDVWPASMLASMAPSKTSCRSAKKADLNSSLRKRLRTFPAAAADSTGLSYEVRFTEEEMTLDGQAREKSWALAPAIELTDRHYPGLIAIDSVSTRVKALWNDKGLLVLYHCLDADIQAEVTERDGRVQRGGEGLERWIRK